MGDRQYQSHLEGPGKAVTGATQPQPVTPREDGVEVGAVEQEDLTGLWGKKERDGARDGVSVVKKREG